MKKKAELWNLKGEAPKVFWKKLKGSKENPILNFSNLELSNYFSTLLKSEESRDDNESEILTPSVDAMTQRLIDETLNHAISLEEVKLMEKPQGKPQGLIRCLLSF